MVDFKKLTLDVVKIEGAVRAFASNRKVIGPTDRISFLEYEIEGDEGKPFALLHVYPRADGTVTLNCSVGKNYELSEQLATYISENAKRKSYEERPLTLKKLNNDAWEILLDLLTETGFVLTKGDLEHGLRFKVSAGKGDDVFIHHYNNGSFLMQGKPWNAYGMVVSILSELLDDKKHLIDAQLETYSITEVTSIGLLEELEQRLPCACSMLGAGIKCMMAPSLAFIKLEIELPDYSAFVYPVIRATEACIKQLLLDKGGYQVNNKVGFGNYFVKDQLKTSVQEKIVCTKSISAIENLYSLYNRHRPGLFHADAIPEMSRLIESRKEAVTLIETIFHIVESNFREIASVKT